MDARGRNEDASAGSRRRREGAVLEPAPDFWVCAYFRVSLMSFGLFGYRQKLAALAVALLTTIVPFSLCLYQLNGVQVSIALADRTSASLRQIRDINDGLKQALVKFAIATIAPSAGDFPGGPEVVDFVKNFESLKQQSLHALTEQERTDLVAAVTAISRSLREQTSSAMAGEDPVDRVVNFVRMSENSRVTRELLHKIESSVAAEAARDNNASFERLRFATSVLLMIMALGTLISIACSLAMLGSTNRARKANESLLQRDADLRIQSERFEAAIENMSQGLCMFDRNRRLTIFNRRYATLYGLNPDQLKPGTSVETILALRVAAGAAPKDTTAYVSDRMKEARANESVKNVHELVDGRFISVSHEPLPDGGWVATHEDITEKKRAETRISYLAHHDALTGLPNRVVLGAWLEEKLAGDGRQNGVAVLCLDLDLFKRVNDTLGHQFGDLLLCQVASRLRTCVRDCDLVARLGGDEFAIVQMSAEQPSSATRLSQRVIDVLGEPFDLDGHQIVIGTSIGVAIAPADGEQAFELLKNADLALYRAKTDGRNTFRFFERSMDARMQARRLLEVDLRKAIGDDQLELVYQPILSAATSTIVGFEALLRWNHPTRGRVAPDDFIPLAEEIGLINAIGEWVLRQACAEAATWPAHVKIAVNLSPVQFRGQNLATFVMTTLASSGLSPRRLELEVTEAVLVHEPDAVNETLTQLRSIGVRIAMDDFGTGYSSLSYLQRFPFDKIKIDKGFMQKTTTDEDAFAIVKAVISLGKSLGMTVTAEGVETREQFERLKAEECTEVQGYLFSPARPATEARRLITRFSGESLRAVA